MKILDNLNKSKMRCKDKFFQEIVMLKNLIDNLKESKMIKNKMKEVQLMKHKRKMNLKVNSEIQNYN